MLNTRGVLDPRFAYFARPVARGAMWATITVARATLADDEWDPFGNEPEFGDVLSYTPIYKGRARVQPNNDWRARKQHVGGEIVTEHAVRIQLDLTGNTIAKVPYPLPGTVDPDTKQGMPGDAGMLLADDLVSVDSIVKPYGFPVDSFMQGFSLVVRVVSASSNSWVRTLLCDFIAQHELPEGS